MPCNTTILSAFNEQCIAGHDDHLRGTPGADPDEAATRQDERRFVRRVLSELPARQAKLLFLRHAGLSYRELAEAIDVAPGSVGTLLSRAESAFEQAMRNMTPDPLEGANHDL